MIGPYRTRVGARAERLIDYVGNLGFPGVLAVEIPTKDFTLEYLNAIPARMAAGGSVLQKAIQELDSNLFHLSVEYFNSIGAKWCNLPSTTLMISSPGAVYQGQQLNYSTDTLPVTINWFDLDRQIFLSESSQFYLELHLLSGFAPKVFSIYNSFRKERADRFHLSEFQHIEFEGKVSFDENINIAKRLVEFLLQGLLRNSSAELSRLLTKEQMMGLEAIAGRGALWTEIDFNEGMRLLAEDTKERKYLEYSMEHFGAWEEIRLTEIAGNTFVVIRNFPTEQVCFYHNDLREASDESLPGVAEAADIIFPGYREVIGSGKRIYDYGHLARKCAVFGLPKEDYKHYIESRRYGAGNTSGFGLGWQRFMHWLLHMPTIWQSTVFPRGHLMPVP